MKKDSDRIATIVMARIRSSIIGQLNAAMPAKFLRKWIGRVSARTVRRANADQPWRWNTDMYDPKTREELDPEPPTQLELFPGPIGKPHPSRSRRVRPKVSYQRTSPRTVSTVKGVVSTRSTPAERLAALADLLGDLTIATASAQAVQTCPGLEADCWELALESGSILGKVMADIRRYSSEAKNHQVAHLVQMNAVYVVVIETASYIAAARLLQERCKTEVPRSLPGRIALVNLLGDGIAALGGALTVITQWFPDNEIRSYLKPVTDIEIPIRRGVRRPIVEAPFHSLSWALDTFGRDYGERIAAVIRDLWRRRKRVWPQ